LLLPRVAHVLRERGTYFWFYSGSTDPMHKQNAAFARELARAGVSHRYFEVYGGHNWALWRDNARAAYLVAAEKLAHA
jgi:enterochelin esterase-like enzyme